MASDTQKVLDEMLQMHRKFDEVKEQVIELGNVVKKLAESAYLNTDLRSKIEVDTLTKLTGRLGELIQKPPKNKLEAQEFLFALLEGYLPVPRTIYGPMFQNANRYAKIRSEAIECQMAAIGEERTPVLHLQMSDAYDRWIDDALSKPSIVRVQVIHFCNGVSEWQFKA